MTLTGYIYDADGNRVAKGYLSQFTCDTNPSDATYNGFQAATDYVLGSSGETMTEMAVNAGNTETWQRIYAYAGGNIVATYNPGDQTNVPTSNGELLFRLTDWLGTLRVTTDYAGNIVSTCAGLPFGDGVNCTGESADPHHFTGKERDSESGNDYFGARYYASTMGRWLSPDWSVNVEPVPYSKLDDPQTLNLYAYVTNNPLSRFDADGHEDDYASKIAQQAASTKGSDHWDISKTNISNGTGQIFIRSSNKCNEYVSDQVVSAGGSATVVAGTSKIATAAQMADPSVKIEGFSEPKPLSEAKAGDIIAQDHGRSADGTREDAHAGLVVAPGQTASANATEGGKVTVNDWGFRSPAASPNNGERNGDASPPPVVRHPLPTPPPPDIHRTP